MAEKTNEEKDREELQTYRLKELLSNPSLFNQTILARFQVIENSLVELMKSQQILETQAERQIKGINLLIDNLNESNSKESKEEDTNIQEDENSSPKAKQIASSPTLKPNVQEDDDEDEDEEIDESLDEEDEDDLGYEDNKAKKGGRI
jgi:hypothetical protein